jgi:hypothetical protein
MPWDNQRSGEWASPLRPDFRFYSMDTESNDIRYNLQIATDATFTTLTVNATSGSSSGFTDLTNPSDLDPFASGHVIQYTVQFDLSYVTYWWRARATDPAGSTLYSSHSSSRSITPGMCSCRF